MNAIAITILSIIIMIGLGYFLKRIDFLSEKDIDPFNRIVMYILMPCMIFAVDTQNILLKNRGKNKIVLKKIERREHFAEGKA